MGTQIHWRAGLLTTALHAAEAIGRGKTLADEPLAAAIMASAQAVATEVRVFDLPWERLWGHLLGLSANASGRRLMVETAVTKTAGRVAQFEERVTRLTAAIASLETDLQAALPGFADEMALRIGPLRQQWEARGDGLLKAVGRLTDDRLIVDACDVLAVYPALGGGGGAHLVYNSARIEAVLANSLAELPEVVRLAWLIAQLQLDLPIYSEEVHPERLPHVAAFAMLPAVLQAAEEVELVRNSPQLMAQAITAWGLRVPADVDATALLTEWWQTYQDTRPPWRVALVALNQLFG
jgi:hypothetical protein